jgi:hypothetical protein
MKKYNTITKLKSMPGVGWYTPVISVLRRLRQDSKVQSA